MLGTVEEERTGKVKGHADPRLRQVDVKAEHYERQVTRAEQERDEWERKHGVGQPWIIPLLPITDDPGSRRKVHAIKEGARRRCRSDGELGEFFQSIEVALE